MPQLVEEVPKMKSGGVSSASTSPQREVEVTVYDRLLDEMRVFRCDLRLLEKSMIYFAPIIKRYLEEEEEETERQENKTRRIGSEEREREAVANTTPKTTDNHNNNNNSYSSNGENATTTTTMSGNVTSGSLKGREDELSSKKKQQNLLPPIPLRVNCDMNIFSWLMAYVEGKPRPITPDNAVSIALSSNFLLMTQLVDVSLQFIKDHFMQVLLSGVNMECLTGELLARLSGMLTEGDIARAFLKLFECQAEYSANRRFLTAVLRHMVCDRFGEGRSSGLRWCRYCGVLFDYHEYKRVTRKGKNVKPIPCPRLAKNSIGPHGEILTTHTPSQHSVNLTFPSISWSDDHVERWAWRVIGATYFYWCRHCNSYILLIDTVQHDCHHRHHDNNNNENNNSNNNNNSGMKTFTCVGGGNRGDGEVLLSWFHAARDIYIGGLTPMYSQQTEIPRESFLELLNSGEWNCDDGSEQVVPGLWYSHPIALEKSVDAAGKVNIDNQNGFERWLAVELQHVMEEFHGSAQHSGLLGSETRTSTPTPPFMYNSTLTNSTTMPNTITTTTNAYGGNGNDVRPPFRSSGNNHHHHNNHNNNNHNNSHHHNNNNRGDGVVVGGRTGFMNGNDTMSKRQGGGVPQRVKTTGLFTRTQHDGSRGVGNPQHSTTTTTTTTTNSSSSYSFAATTRGNTAQAGKQLSMQTLATLNSGLGKRNATVSQTHR